MVELAGSEGGEARFHGQHIVAQARTGLFEGHSVAPHDMCAYLGADTQTKFATRGFLELPCRGCRDERTARKGNGDTGREREAGRGLRGDRSVEICGPARFGEQQSGESDGLGAAREVTDL